MQSETKVEYIGEGQRKSIVLALVKWNHNLLVHVYNIYDKMRYMHR